MRKALAVVTAGLALALTAQPASAHDAKPPDGYHTVTVKKAGFSMAVPDAWLVLDPTSKSYRDQLQKMAEANPELDSLIEQIDPSRSKLLALDRTNPTSTYSSNVQVLSVDYGKSVVSQPKAVKAEFESEEAFEDVEVDKTKVAGRRALEAYATFELNSPDGPPVRVHFLTSLVPAKKDVLQIAFGTTEDGRQDPTVQTMIDSFKILR